MKYFRKSTALLLCFALTLGGYITSLPLHVPLAQAVVTYPTIYTFTLDDYRANMDRADWYDKQLFVATIQGIVNQKGPRLYVHFKATPTLGQVTEEDANNVTQFWWDKFRQRGQWLSEYQVVNLTSLDALVDQFKSELNGLVAWDPRVDATVNVATTIAGVDKLAAVMHGGELYNQYTTGDYNLPVVEDLNGQFSGANAKTDAYIWAKEQYLDVPGKANPGILGFAEDGYTRQLNTDGADPFTMNRDLLVMKKGFVFDLSSYEYEKPVDAPNQTLGADRETLISILETAYNNYGVNWPIQLIGYTPWWDKYATIFEKPISEYTPVESEVVLMKLVSAYNVTMVSQDINGGNGSVHSWSPVGAKLVPPTKAPPRQTLGTNKTYVTYYNGDHDGSTQRSFYFLWDDAYRAGGDAVGFGTVPNAIDDYRDVAKYYYDTATDNDFFWAQSGAGYTNPNNWICDNERLWEGTWSCSNNQNVWEEFNNFYFDKMGWTMTGFILNGGDHAASYVEKSLSVYSHDGFAGDVGEPNPDIRANNTAVAKRVTDIDRDNLQAAVNHINVALTGKNPGSQNNFLVIRLPFGYYHHINAINEILINDYPAHHFEIVDPYTFFSLIRQHKNNQENDAIDIDVQMPIGDLIAGQKYDVSVTIRNVGSGTWTHASSYRLGADTKNQLIWSDGVDGGYSTSATDQRIYLNAGDSIAPQETKTFTFQITAPATAGNYLFSGKMVRDGVAWFGSSISRTMTVVNAPANAAEIISVTAPEYMEEEEVANIDVEVKNIGTATWTAATDYKLGSLLFLNYYPLVTENQFNWNGTTDSPLNQRLLLDGEDSIAPGQTKTFSFTVKAPKTRGTYTLSGRMIREGVEWFGEKFEQDIRVVPSNRGNLDHGLIGALYPAYMKAGTTRRVSVSVKNLGNDTWSSAGNYRLMAAASNAFTFTNMKDGGYSNSLTDQRVYLSAADQVKPEDTKTFLFDITAPATSGTYVFSVDLIQDGVAQAGQVLTFPIRVSGDDDDAVFINTNVPLTVTAGSRNKITLDIANAGENTWTKANNYRLGATEYNDFIFTEFDDGYSTSPTNQRIFMGDVDYTLIGKKKTFSFDIVAPGTPGTYTFEVRMIRDGVGWFGQTKTVVIDVISPYMQNVNVGGTGYTDSSGEVWSADQAYSPSSWGYTGTTTTVSTNAAITVRSNYDLIDQQTYQTLRMGSNFGYQFDVPNGTYGVRLAVAELTKTADRQRVFNLNIEGKEVWRALDPWKMMYGNHNGAYIVYQIPVTDGQLNLDFTSVADEAIINGIQVWRID